MSEGVQTFGESELAGLFKVLKVAPHPMVKLPALPWVHALMAAKPDGWKAELVQFLQRRQTRINLAESDPLFWGWEFEPWADVDRLCLGTWTAPSSRPGRSTFAKATEDADAQPDPRDAGATAAYRPAAADVVGLFGGNRASKTVYSVKRGCQTAFLFSKTVLPILSESETASIATVQKLVWYYFKPYFNSLNGKRDAVFKINYSQAGGFTDRKLVLPNGSEIYFLTYNQDPGDYEGWEFGAPAHTYTTVCEALRSATTEPGQFVPPGGFIPANIGGVADESMPLAWLKMFARRLKFRRSKLLWPFTPVKGITPAIKEMVGTSAVTLESRPSELLPRQNFPGIPAGHMPYIRECNFPGVKAMAVYFFSIYNKFGPSPDRTYYEEIKQLCDGKTSEYIERVAYGMARDGVARAFPKFGAWNIVRRSQLPALRTNYFLTDPAGARNWATFWVGVTPSGEHFIYRDWPDAQTFGEWAVPTEREVNEQNRSGWDGDMGPAQAGMGMGIVKYKQTFLECEKVKAPSSPARRDTRPDPRDAGATRDPYHVKLLEKAAREGVTEVQEEVCERYVDPRAGASEHMAEKGGTCIIDEFDDVQIGADGKVTGPAMELIPASGVNEDEGLGVVNELLDWNLEQPLMPVLNQPKLFVCEDAQQVIWMFENYTGRGGAKGACKDFADLVRYMALAKLTYVDAKASKGKPGGGF